MKEISKFFLGSISSGFIIGCIYGGVKKKLLKNHIKELEKIKNQMEEDVEKLERLKEETITERKLLDARWRAIEITEEIDDEFKKKAERLKTTTKRLTSY